MRSEKPRSHRGRLLASLADGVCSFKYRGSVYRLLGVPVPQESVIAFRRPMPPAGFRYRDWPFEGFLSSPPVDSHPKTKRGSGDEIPMETHTTEGRRRIDLSSQGELGDRPGPDGGHHRRDEIGIVVPGRGADGSQTVEPRSERETARTAPRKTEAQSAWDRARRPHGEDRKGRLEPRPPMTDVTETRASPVSAADNSRTVADNSLSAARPRPSPAQPPSAEAGPEPAEAVPLRGEVMVAGPRDPDLPGKVGAPAGRRADGSVKPSSALTETDVPPSGGHVSQVKCRAGEGDESDEQVSGRLSIPRDSTAPPVLQFRQGLVEEVEHLRGAIRRLAEGRLGRDREPPQQAPSSAGPPIQQPRTVFVYRQPPGPVRRVSGAFWGSSTLRSRHLRVLR